MRRRIRAVESLEPAHAGHHRVHPRGKGNAAIARLVAAPHGPGRGLDVRTLQRTIGNRATARLLANGPGLTPGSMTLRRDHGGTPVAGPTDTVTEEKKKAERYLAAILAGKTHTDLGVTRKAMLDLMQEHLPADDFAAGAAALMLLMPGSVVDSAEAKKKAMEILRVELHDKDIARRMLDQNVAVIVIPRNKTMTDLVQFDKLKGTKTFDGRKWEDVRGAGGFQVPGTKAIYVAVAEENLAGTNAEAGAAATQWCYSKGYSTASHEMAHAIDLFGLTPDDRKLVDDAYQKKHALEMAAKPQEWIDGINYREAKTSKMTECYASVHRLEYFAQTANAYFGTNGGDDPFTFNLWKAAAKPENGKRRNGKAQVEKLEPELSKLMKRIFGDKDIKSANPRK